MIGRTPPPPFTRALTCVADRESDTLASSHPSPLRTFAGGKLYSSTASMPGGSGEGIDISDNGSCCSCGVPETEAARRRKKKDRQIEWRSTHTLNVAVSKQRTPLTFW